MTVPEAPFSADRRMFPGHTITNLDVARVAHAANQVLREALDEPDAPAWHELGTDSLEGLVRGVLAARSDEYDPEQMHALWCDSKLEQGWTLGEYSYEARMHPNLVPYELLPVTQQVKDFLFSAIVRALEPIIATPATT